MGALVTDAERLLDHLRVKDCVFVGLSIGGMIAQGLAVKRLDLVRGMVLSNTAAKIGTAQMWEDRIAAIRAGGIEALADAVMERWFSKAFRQTEALTAWRNMLIRQPAEGYIGCGAAIAGTDFYTTTATLTLPTLAIAGTEDGSTPPDLVRETAELIRGSRFHLMRGAGHLPCVEKPGEYAELLTEFLREIGHV
jgi:3-oxoadipate enol-lactonase